MHLALRCLTVVVALAGVSCVLGSPLAALAQERCASADAAMASTASEILDPFAAMPRTGAAVAPLGEIVAEIIDPFEGTTVRAVTARVLSEIVDPFVTSAMAARSEILDPWSS